MDSIMILNCSEYRLPYNNNYYSTYIVYDRNFSIFKTVLHCYIIVPVEVCEEWGMRSKQRVYAIRL